MNEHQWAQWEEMYAGGVIQIATSIAEIGLKIHENTFALYELNQKLDELKTRIGVLAGSVDRASEEVRDSLSLTR